MFVPKLLPVLFTADSLRGGAPVAAEAAQGADRMATKRAPRARISVSTPEVAIIFRGESVSGHPGARGGPKNFEHRPENSRFFYFLQKIKIWGAIFENSWASQGPGVAGNGFSAKNDSQFRGRD